MWLDPARTSPFRFYQFWLNSDDRDVVTYLKFFTFRSQEEIAELEREAQAHPERRDAQRELARDVTALVHGADAVARAERAAAVLFGGSLAEAAVEDILTVFDDAPSISIDARVFGKWHRRRGSRGESGPGRVEGRSGPLDQAGRSLRERRRLTEERGQVTMADAIGRSVIVLRKGQRERRIVKVQA